MNNEQIAEVLDNLLKLNEIHASMVASRNGDNVMPNTESFKPGVDRVWNDTLSATEKVFDVIQKLSPAGLGEIKIRLQDYNVLFYVFPGKENVLISITSAKIPEGALEVEIEKARQEILNIMENRSK